MWRFEGRTKCGRKLLVVEAALYVWDSVLQERGEWTQMSPWWKWGTPQVVAILHANNYRDIESDKQGGRRLWRRLWSYEVVILLQKTSISSYVYYVMSLIQRSFRVVVLMEKIWGNHLGCIKPCKSWDMDTISSGDRRISSINRGVVSTDDVLWCHISAVLAQKPILESLPVFFFQRKGPTPKKKTTTNN